MRRPVTLTDIVPAVLCCAALRNGCIGYRNAPLLLPIAKARSLCVYKELYMNTVVLTSVKLEVTGQERHHASKDGVSESGDARIEGAKRPRFEGEA